MNIEIKDGKAIININSLMEEFGEDGRITLVNYMSLENSVIDAVVDLLIDGHTKDGAWISHVKNDAVERARIRLLAASDPVLHQVAKAMMRDRQNAEIGERIYSDWAYALYRSWPRNGASPPWGPKRIVDKYPWPEGVEVQEEIDRKLAEIQARLKADDHDKEGG